WFWCSEISSPISRITVTEWSVAPAFHGRVPADMIRASTPRSASRLSRIAAAIGERQALPVHTTRMSMTRESTEPPRSRVVGKDLEIALRQLARAAVNSPVVCPDRVDFVAHAVLAEEEPHLTVAEHGARAELQQDVARLHADLFGESAWGHFVYFG